MKIQQENICKCSRIHKIREHFISSTIPIKQFPAYGIMLHFMNLYDDINPIISNCNYQEEEVLFHMHCNLDCWSVTVLLIVM